MCFCESALPGTTVPSATGSRCDNSLAKMYRVRHHERIRKLEIANFSEVLVSDLALDCI